VHGDYGGAWKWRKLKPFLALAGFEVHTLSRTGLGDRAHLLTRETGLQTHVDDVVNLIEAEELSDVVLVGHSSGGRVVSGVACTIPDRLSTVMYLDSSNLELGNPIKQRRFWPDVVEVGPDRVPCFKPWTSPERWGITDPDDVAWVNRHNRPQPVKVHEDRLDLNLNTVLSLSPKYVAFIPDHNIDRDTPITTYEWVKRQSEFTYRELSGMHCMHVTHPREVSALMLEMLASGRTPEDQA
jgi:pimeloyl-ACP methyl ester carboxylesterase